MMEEQQYYLDQDGVAYTIVESQQVRIHQLRQVMPGHGLHLNRIR